DVDYRAITQDSMDALTKALTDAVANVADPAKKALTDLIGQMGSARAAEDAKASGAPPAGGATPTPPAPGTPPPPTLTQIHRSLRAVSPLYLKIMGDICQQLNLLPPSGGMAGVYTRVDNTLGVFKAPANTGISSVVSP